MALLDAVHLLATHPTAANDWTIIRGKVPDILRLLSVELRALTSEVQPQILKLVRESYAADYDDQKFSDAAQHLLKMITSVERKNVA